MAFPFALALIAQNVVLPRMMKVSYFQFGYIELGNDHQTWLLGQRLNAISSKTPGMKFVYSAYLLAMHQYAVCSETGYLSFVQLTPRRVFEQVNHTLFPELLHSRELPFLRFDSPLRRLCLAWLLAFHLPQYDD